MYKATRTLNAILAGSWAMTEDALTTLITVALRENESVEAVEARLGRPLDNTHTVSVRDGIATIPVAGPIFRYANLFTMISGGTTVDTLATDLTTALDDPAIRGIALYIDSPGGEVSGIHEFAQMVNAGKGRKPIVAYVADLGTSAAYWIATAAGEVVIDATATVGSIGVIAAMRDPSAEKSQRITFVSSQSPHKRSDPTTESGRSQIQTYLDDLAAVFVADVAAHRGVSEETVLSDFGQGGVIVGQKAVALGMADRIGSYESVLADLIQRTAPSALRARTIGASTMSGEEELQAQIAQMQERLAQQENANKAALEALATERTARIKTEAAATIEAQVRDGKLLPAEAAHYTAIYAQLAQDDLNAPLASGSRVDLLRSAFGARPQHSKTEEQLPTAQHILEPHGAAQPESADAKEQRRKTLLAMSETGRAALNGSRK